MVRKKRIGYERKMELKENELPIMRIAITTGTKDIFCKFKPWHNSRELKKQKNKA